MFNKKVMAALLNLIALLIIVKVVFMAVMFIWMYVGEPPFFVFNPQNSQMQNVLLFIVELGSNGFLYLLLAAVHTILFKKMQSAPAAKPARRTTRRRTTRKKK